SYIQLSVIVFFQAEDGIRDFHVTGVQTCALPILRMLYERSGKGNENAPRYLLLFGQGTYNPRSSEGSSRSLVVTYQSENSIHYKIGRACVGKECRSRRWPNN